MRQPYGSRLAAFSGAGHTCGVRSPAVVAAAAAAAVLTVGAAASPAPPTLKLVQTRPLVVAGTHFIPGEHVTVTAWTLPRAVRHTVAHQGAFKIALGNARFVRCAAARVEAVGAEGSRALVRLPRPFCLPRPSPGTARRRRSFGATGAGSRRPRLLSQNRALALDVERLRLVFFLVVVGDDHHS